MWYHVYGTVANGQRISIGGVTGTTANGMFYAKTNGYPAGQFAMYTDPALTKPWAADAPYLGGGRVEAGYRGQGVTPTAGGYMDITYTADRPASYRCDSKSYRKLSANYPPGSSGAGWYSLLYNSAAAATSPGGRHLRRTGVTAVVLGAGPVASRCVLQQPSLA